MAQLSYCLDIGISGVLLNYNFGRFQWLDLQHFKCVLKKSISLIKIVARENFLFRGWYCWWKTSCTSWYDTVNMPLFFLQVLYMPSGCFGISSINVTILVTTHDVSCLQECLDERVQRLSLNHHGFGASLGSIVEKKQWKVKVNEGLLLALLLKWSKHMGVSRKRGTPKLMVYNGKPY